LCLLLGDNIEIFSMVKTSTSVLIITLDSFNKFDCVINLGLIMGGIFLCNCNGRSYVNGGQWMEPQENLKKVVATRDVEGFDVAMFNIRKALITCAWIFGILHPQDMKNHHVD
jgi:hypothetical protein